MINWVAPNDELAPPPAPVADVLREPGELGTLGLPRGFILSGQNLPCDDSTSAFVRGVLLPKNTYDSLPIDERLSLDDPNRYPLWRLYGGPLATRQLAAEWSRWLYFWAFNNNQVWVGHGEWCVAPSWAVKWPTDSSFQWSWVWDTSPGKIANRYWDGTKNVIQVVG